MWVFPGNVSSFRICGICVSPENGTCTVKAEDGEYVLRCTENAQCYPTTGICHCDPDTQHDPLTLECKFSYGSERCEKETDCDTASFLICREGKCECQDPELQIYDEKARKCKALVGGSCTTDANNTLLPVCTGPDMECKSGKCACTGELEETADHKCGRVYDKECDAEKICVEPFWCDLEADEKKCRCRPNQEYDSGTCIILAGGTCPTKDKLECTAHSTCTDELCTCDSDYVAVDGKCIGSYGANCTDVVCNDSDFLECNENVCTCKPDYVKDDADKKCRGKINQPCKSEQDHDDCVANSECKSIRNELKCTCPYNYIKSSDNLKCYGRYGAACDNLIACYAAELLDCNVYHDDPTTTVRTTTAEESTTSVDLLSTNISEFTLFQVIPNSFNPFDIFEKQSRTRSCGCKRPTIRHLRLNRCVSPPGKACDLPSDNGHPIRNCTQFAQCYPESSNNEGICRCDSYATPDDRRGVCALTFGSDKCYYDEDCDKAKDLRCMDRVCLCNYKTQKWSESRQRCEHVYGGSCSWYSDDPPPVCVDNASCAGGFCRCNSGGYIPTPEKECKLDFDHTCETDEDCHPSFICSDDSTCACPSGQVYFQSTKSCHIAAGSECSEQDNCTLHSDCLSSICTCEGGYEAQGSICQALYGSRCSSETPCLEDKFLNECPRHGGVCECLLNYEFNEAEQRCQGNLNEKCSVEEDCVTEFGCDGDLCKCKDNRIPDSSMRKCYSGYHQDCTTIDCSPNFKCNTTAENGQMGDYTCVCEFPLNQIYNETLGRCVGLERDYGSAGGDRQFLNILQFIFSIVVITQI